MSIEFNDRNNDGQQDKSPKLTHEEKLFLTGASTVIFGLVSIVSPVCYIPASASALAFGRELRATEEEAIQEEK